MNETVLLAEPPVPVSSLPGKLRLLPGILLLVATGLGGKALEAAADRLSAKWHLGLPHGEYILWSILLGMTISNTIGIPAVFRPGIATYQFWLKLGIVLLGVRFILGDLLHLGTLALGLVLLEIIFSLAFMTLLGMSSGLRPKLISLLAIGSSVCGISAILATCDVIGADDDDTYCAITAILTLGILSLIFFPLIGHWLHLNNRTYGLWAGLAVDNTAEATAAGAIYSSAAGKVAVLTKTCRNAMLGFVVLGYALYWGSRGQAQVISSKAAFVWRKFPKFILGFLAISILASLSFFSPDESQSIMNLSHWAFLLAFAGVGFRTDLRRLGRQGFRPFLVGISGEIAIALVTLAMVCEATRLFPR